MSSYLPDVAGGVVVACAFADQAAASGAIDLLRSSGVRQQDVSVIARDGGLAERIAGDRAWTPARNANGLLRRLLPGSRLPSELRTRYRDALAAGRIVVVAAVDGQPADTVAALFAQAKGDRIEQWWQTPADLFAPPESGGPF
ncbi:MAG: hypothetical protein HYU87_02560 [Chloroflexi bacterium]|nr:hypothetical protein [Chloroflexota bacterium]